MGKSVPIRDRILQSIHMNETTGCWLWQKCLQANGYAMIGIGSRTVGDRKRVYAHRVSYEIFVGPIPVGMDLDHLCRVRHCVNPAHLEPVSRRENSLRGIAPAMLGALNGSKTHCIHGHEFTSENTYVRPRGGRVCLTCEQEGHERRLQVEQTRLMTLWASMQVPKQNRQTFLQLFEDYYPGALMPSQIAEKLFLKIGNVRQMLIRMLADGQIVRVSRGMYSIRESSQEAIRWVTD